MRVFFAALYIELSAANKTTKERLKCRLSTTGERGGATKLTIVSVSPNTRLRPLISLLMSCSLSNELAIIYRL